MDGLKLQNEQRSVKYKNNFNILRMIAALCVMRGHMSIIAGTNVPTFGGMEIHTFGVSVLFIISGYLNSKSWDSDPHYGRFLLKRLARLWPSYALFIIFAVFVAGPVLSELGPAQYFRSNYSFYLNNLRFYIVYWLPGVFGEGMPYPNVINGSLWTMPVELVLCLICPIVLSLCGKASTFRLRNLHMAVIVGIVALLEVLRTAFFPEAEWIAYGTNWMIAWRLVTYYFIGMAFARLNIRKHLNLQASAIMLILLSGIYIHRTFNLILSMVIIPYFVFSFALDDQPIFVGFGAKYELSYGVFLYGFFFQQFTTWLFNVRMMLLLNELVLFLISLALTFIAAWLSYVLIERPVIRLTSYLIGQSKKAS